MHSVCVSALHEVHCMPCHARYVVHALCEEKLLLSSKQDDTNEDPYVGLFLF